MAKEYREFDFREIAALDDTAKSLKGWVAKASSFFNDFWKGVSDIGVQLSLSDVSTMTYDKALQGVSRTCYSTNLSFDRALRAHWWMDAAQLKLIAWEMLSLPIPDDLIEKEDQPEDTDQSENADQDAENPEDTELPGDAAKEDEPSKATEKEAPELTSVERVVAKLCLDEITTALQYAWMGTDPLNVEPGELDRDPLKSRAFRLSELVTKVCIKLETKSGSLLINWVSPRQNIVDLMDTFLDPRKSEDSPPKKTDPALVSQARFNIKTILGATSLRMMDVAKLREGQLIKLDQRIDAPLEVCVNDKPTYRGWPGKRGSTQALEIQSFID